MFDASAGHTWLPPLLLAPCIMALFWWLMLALGSRILRFLPVPLTALTVWEHGLLALAVGTGVIQYLPYLLGAAHWLSPRALGVSFGLLTAILARDLRRVARRVRAEVSLLSPKISRAQAVWLALFCALMGMLLIRAIVPGVFADDDGYHLSAPKRWLGAGSLDYLPTYTATNSSLGFEMLYLMAMATGTLVGVKLLHYSAGVFSLFGVFLAARRLGTPTAGPIAISILLVSSPFLVLPGLLVRALVDFGPAWMSIVSVLVWLAWRQCGQGKLLLLFALCAGFAGSFKSTALSVGLAWAPALVWEARRRKIPWWQIAKATVGLGIIALVPALPWLFRSYRVTGNPAFPMLSGWIPTRDWDPELARIFSRFIHYYSWGIHAGAALGEPQRRLLVAATGLAIVLVSGVAIVRLREAAWRELVLFAATFSLISLAVAGLVFRYWLPAILCAVLVVSCWWARRVSASVAAWSAPAILCLALALEIYRPCMIESLGAQTRVALGVSTLDAAYDAFPAWQMWRFINANTPADAHVLMASFYDSFGASSYGAYWVDRTCLATDSHMQRYIRLDTWPAFRQSLSHAHVDYVLIAERQLSPGRHGFSFPAERNEYAFCRRLVDEHAHKVAQFEIFQLYRLDDAIRAEASADGARTTE